MLRLEHARFRVEHAAALLTIALLCAGCDWKADTPPETAEGWNAMQSSSLANDFRACIEQAVALPWRTTLAQLRDDGGFSVRIEADSSDLQLRRRPGDYRQQRLVELHFGRFRHYTLFSPRMKQPLIDAGALAPLAAIGERPAAAFAPFEVFKLGTSTLFINVAGGEFCLTHDTPPDWPNPSIRCQIVRDGYTGSARFSAEAAEQLPELFPRFRALFDRLAPCFDML